MVWKKDWLALDCMPYIAHPCQRDGQSWQSTLVKEMDPSGSPPLSKRWTILDITRKIRHLPLY